MRLSIALAKPERDINQYIPQVSDSNLSQEELWLATIQPFTQTTSPSKPSIRYMESDGKKIAIIESQPNYVIKEARSWWNGDVERLLREAMGSLIMESEDFKHLRTPILVAIRRHGSNDIIMIIQTRVPGNTFEYYFLEMAPLEVGSVEHANKVKQFNKPCFAFGKGKGELYSQCLKDKLVPSTENIAAEVEGLLGFLNRINNLLGQIYERKININAHFIKLLIDNYKKHPGYLGYVFRFHSSDLIWSEEYTTVGIVDVEAVCSNLDVSLKPTSNISRGFGDCLRFLKEKGLALGISLEGIEGWEESFREGYEATFNGRVPSEANHFL